PTYPFPLRCRLAPGLEHVSLDMIMLTRTMATADTHTVLETRAVTKAFGATRALVDCTFALRAGEVHCIVGENGSGKSRLGKLLSGVHRPDDGTLEVEGTALDSLRSPRQAAERGIATVFQEVLVVESQSVLDNVWMGSDGLLRSALTLPERRGRATVVLE